ncbi:hypothetical protein TNIN_141921 [Trichonephila inaurata madagascariensis]|uniref:Secreted protein n=1 Tax=Trichonephila inaurata madagascariensis TaxID=2747483 RepID=A0A8X7C673_9ARAC|nr:hypothetical protein TNIN_141921 [Trichonephila inaurata madagascariensis]
MSPSSISPTFLLSLLQTTVLGMQKRQLQPNTTGITEPPLSLTASRDRARLARQNCFRSLLSYFSSMAKEETRLNCLTTIDPTA